MFNEYAYCPRLFHLLHVEGRWAGNAFTAEGRAVHHRVDKLDHVLPDPEALTQLDGDSSPSLAASPSASTRPDSQGDEPPAISRSVPLASERLGLSAKLDLVATADGEALPVETKHGRVPDNEQRCYEPERVQLMAQGLLLREHGYRCDLGVLYFAGSRTRVEVPFTRELEARTFTLIGQARQASLQRDYPAPLDASPKCVGCSLGGICLPDETLILQQVPPDPVAPNVRRLYPARDEAVPLYMQEQGATVGKRGQSLIITRQHEELADVKLKDVSQLVLCGNITVTAPTIQLLCEASIPIVHLSMGHWFYGITSGTGLLNAYGRAAQFTAASQQQCGLAFSRELVAAKGANQRTMLRRNGSPPP